VCTRRWKPVEWFQGLENLPCRLRRLFSGVTSIVSDIEHQLSTLLGHITELPDSFNADSDLIDDLALESMQVMEFVMEAEDHFDVAIAQDRLADVRTLAQLATVIEKLRGPAR